MCHNRKFRVAGVDLVVASPTYYARGTLMITFVPAPGAGDPDEVKI
jgi:hypothetical protein